MDDYDFVLELNPAVAPRYFQNIDADPTVWASKGSERGAEGRCFGGCVAWVRPHRYICFTTIFK